MLLALVLLANVARAQELVVKSFGVADSDLSAMACSRLDLNGVRCAIVKVRVALKDVRFDGAIKDDVMRLMNEYWVYMPQRTPGIRVYHPDYLPLEVCFADYGIDCLESGRTYVLVLAKPGMGDANAQAGTAQQSAALAPSAPSASGSTITIAVNDSVSIEMVKVEAGTFMMGATTDTKDPNYDELPAHRVTLTNNYYIGKYEVTQALWKAVMKKNPSYIGYVGDNLPVNQVSWNDCQNFIYRLNVLTNRHFRLPTEAEWEYAARGGNKSRGYRYSGSNLLEDVAWFFENTGSMIRVHAVGKRQPNELGIYDMCGNVAEWCEDFWGVYSNLPQINPTGAKNGYRVYRGGNAGANDCRISARNYDNPGYNNELLGLRLCLTE